MKIVYNILLIICLIQILSSCYKNSRDINSYKKGSTFISYESDSSQTKPFPIVSECWNLIEEHLVCKTNNPDSVFVCVNLSTFQEENTFGKKGRGSMEWMSPHVMAKGTNNFIVLDNGNKKIYSIENNFISFEKTSKISDAVNDVKTIKYPIIGYVSISPNKQSLIIYDIEKDLLIDSLSFVDETNNGNASLYDFTWSIKNENIVIAHQYSDQFSICSLDTNCKLTSINEYQTNSNYSQDKMIYSDVACGRYIYLLSQRNVDLEMFTGFSEIEIFDYKGVGIKKITLDIIADKMVLDEKRNRIILSSEADAAIKIITL